MDEIFGTHRCRWRTCWTGRDETPLPPADPRAPPVPWHLDTHLTAGLGQHRLGPGPVPHVLQQYFRKGSDLSVRTSDDPRVVEERLNCRAQQDPPLPQACRDLQRRPAITSSVSVATIARIRRP